MSVEQSVDSPQIEPEAPAEGVTIPEIDPPLTPPKKECPKKRKGFCVFLYFIFVLLPLGALGYFVYEGCGTLTSLKAQLANQKLMNRTQINQLQSEFESYRTNSDKYNQKMQEWAAAQALQIHQLTDKHNWRISEAIYLVAIAQERLNMVGDTSTTIKLLQTAEDRLKNVGDVRTSPARESIAHDINDLETKARFDKIGLWVELGVLRRQIENLSFHTLQASIEGQPEILGEEPVPVTKAAWRQALEKTWQELKGLIKVREFNADKLNSSLEPKDQLLLLRAMDLSLIEAQWGVLQEEPLVYQQSLDRIEDKLQIYFVQDDLWKQVNAQINLLKKKDIKPVQIDLSHTLKLLKALDSGTVS
jgi:uroporphyrin-3 C-methyltransferase